MGPLIGEKQKHKRPVLTEKLEVDWTGCGLGPLAWYCEHGNELSESFDRATNL
jgi:hypothetical protein